MAKMSTDELLDAFKEMSLLELSEFVKAFEETFDVTAAAPVAVAAAAAPAAGGGDAGGAAEEKDEFDVILEADGGNKIAVIRHLNPAWGPIRGIGPHAFWVCRLLWPSGYARCQACTRSRMARSGGALMSGAICSLKVAKMTSLLTSAAACSVSKIPMPRTIPAPGSPTI
jgi:ribosomal protein L7/L12